MRNEIKISWRHLINDKTNSFIIIFGLAVAITVVTIISAYIRNEYNYNYGFKNIDNIYRITITDFNVASDQKGHTGSNSSPMIANKIKDNFQEVDEIVVTTLLRDVKICSDNENWITESYVLGASDNIFKAFGINILHGTEKDVYESDNKILISKSLSQKLFNTDNSVNETIKIRINGQEFIQTIAGVYQDIAKNSTIKGNVIINKELIYKNYANNDLYGAHDISKEDFYNGTKDITFLVFTNYICFKPNVNIEEFKKKLADYKYEYERENYLFIQTFTIKPLSKIHVDEGPIDDNNLIEEPNPSFLKILALIGIMVYLIGFTNYVNLISVQISKREKLYALTRSIGADNINTYKQIIIESVLTTLISFPFSLIITAIAIQHVGKLVGKDYELTFSSEILPILGIIFLVTIIFSLLAGVIVSLRVGNLNIAEILKGKNNISRSSSIFNKSLTIFQITMFIAVAISIIVINKQIEYAQNKDLGFEKEGLITFKLNKINIQKFKTEIENIEGVESVSFGIAFPPTDMHMGISMPKNDNNNEWVNLKCITAGPNYGKTLGLRFIEGDDFKDDKEDAVILDKKACEKLGFTNNVIGQKTYLGPVIGIVEEVNLYDFHSNADATIYWLNTKICQEGGIRINMANAKNTIEKITKVWNELFAPEEFNFKFTNQKIQQLYYKELQLEKTSTILGVIILIISIMGLIGLSSTLNSTRKTEIAIRKINGANIFQILYKLCKQYGIYVIISAIIATPLAYLFSNKWLSDFQVRIDMPISAYIIASLLAFVVVILTVTLQSIKVANSNPVEALNK